ncbi:DUF4256 domain-containing protein [bacterium]|nr:DUF4256 domain-containing protein [bacterium]
MRKNKDLLSAELTEDFLSVLETRFGENKVRHPEINWEDVRARLEAAPEKLWSLNEMERTDGEPDVVGLDEETGEVLFYDCSPESPEGRRSLCYDREALESRKAHKPKDTALDMAEAMGVELLTEDAYFQLQELGEFDLKTSSWLKTPENVRELGGAIFGDRRFDRVFIYHNGAESYYGARGFRGVLRV